MSQATHTKAWGPPLAPRQTSYSFPSVHISCPCNESIAIAPLPPQSPIKQSTSAAAAAEQEEAEEEDETFDPRSPRSNFTLFPLDNLLYCEDCNQIRCPRCVHDEIICHFCPSCLFEVPSSAVKTEGNRCTRNCFSCPICFAALSVAATGEDQAGPYILLCNHCLWSSKEIGIEFEKPTSITAQLMNRLRPASGLFRSASGTFPSPLTSGSSSDSYFPSTMPPAIVTSGGEEGRKAMSSEERFFKLRAHYTQQRAGAGADEYGSSPGAFSRLMGLYSGLSGSGRNRSFNRGVAAFGTSVGKGKAEWTEWDGAKQMTDDEELVEKIKHVGFGATLSVEQRSAQFHNARFVDEVRPLATLLRTKRSKRCRACRHILVKPEPKVTNRGFRIKLVAMHAIPALSISRLDPSVLKYEHLTPLSTHQFLLTVTNPLFDPINVTLATPAKTPGRHPSTVTILCPDFAVSANTDVWDEALQPTTALPAPTIKKGKKTGMLTGNVWDSGRNWTTVVIEVVPPLLPLPGTLDENGEETATEDERLVQIPVSVRVVYETDLGGDDSGLGRETKERREHTYWSVLGVGRISEKMPTKKAEDVATPLPTRPLSLGTGRSAAGSSSSRHGGGGGEPSGRTNRHSVR